MTTEKFYAEDPPERPHIYDTEAEAMRDATESLRIYRRDAKQDGEWQRAVEDVVVGRVHVTDDDPDDYEYVPTHRATAVGNDDDGYDYVLKVVEPPAKAPA